MHMTRFWLLDFWQTRLIRIRGGYRSFLLLVKLLGHRKLFHDDAYKTAHKLNLGCAEHVIPGWINVDIRPIPGATVLSDIRRLCFQSESFDIVRASHVLEHIPWWEVEQALKEWTRVLKNGGWLIVGVPDFDAIVMRYLRDRDSLKPLRQDSVVKLLPLIYGEGCFEPKPYYEHKMGYNRESLKDVLSSLAGLTNIRLLNFVVEEPYTLGITDSSTSIYSLNMAGQKL